MGRFLRIGIGSVFLVAASAKLQYPYDFLESVYKYHILGPELSEVVAIWLPWTEIVVGLMLIGGSFRDATYLLSLVLGACFLFAKAWVIRSEAEVGCGCVALGPSSLIGMNDLFLSAVFEVVIGVSWWLEARVGGRRSHPA